MSNDDGIKFNIDEHIFLSKFQGDALPENEFERMEIKNGEIVAVHKIENGEIVDTKIPGGDS